MVIPKILIDSNILVYSINRSSPKHVKAQDFLSKNAPKLVVAHQNILESLRVLTHAKFPNPMKIKEAIDVVFDLTKAFDVTNPNIQTIYVAQRLIEKYSFKGDKIFDAYLTATALSNDIKIIATDNIKDFKIFEEIEVINPFS